MKTVTVTFDANGDIHIEADGFADAGCLDAIKKIGEAFGAPVEHKHKREAHLAVNKAKGGTVKS